MSDPIKQHYIPSSHLARFTVGRTKSSDMWVTDLKDKKQHVKTPNSIGYMKHLYTLDVDEDTYDRYQFEKAFGELENEASQTFKRILKSERIPNHITQPTDYEILITYMALLAVRTPQKIELMTKPVVKTQEIALDIMTSTPERWEAVKNNMASSGEGRFMDMRDIPFEEVKNITDRVKIQVIQNYKIEMMLNMFENLIPLLGRRFWTLYLSKEDITTMPQLGGFICSDHPVSIISLKKLPPICAPGFGMLHTEVSMPISENAALVGSFDGCDSTRIISIKGIASINSRTMMYANRYLLHANKNFIWEDRSNEIKNASEYLELIKNEK